MCKGDHSKLSWTQVETGSAITWKYPSCVLAGDHSESNFAKAQAFLQAFAQSLGVKLQTDLAFPIRQGGVNDAQA